MAALNHLPSSALRRAAYGTARVFFAESGYVAWQRVKQAHSFEVFRSLAGWAVYCRLRDARYPAECMLCCGCGRPRWQIANASRPKNIGEKSFIECDVCFAKEQTAKKEIHEAVNTLKALIKSAKTKRRNTL